MAENKTERLKRWQTRAEIARKLRQNWETDFKVERLERFWAGKHKEDRDDDDQIWLNHFFATAITQEATLLPSQSSFIVKPKSGTRQKPFGTTEAKLQSAILDAIATQDDNLYNDATLALSQAYFRIGVLKMVYDPKFEPNPLAEEEGFEGEPDEVLTDEVYTFQWVDACKMLLPDEGPNPRSWPWIGEEVEVSLDDAKADTRFRHRTQLKANGTADPEAGDHATPPDIGDPKHDEYARFRYIEVWDIHKKRHLVWADGGQDFEDFLIEEDFPPGIEDHPYSILSFLPITAKPFMGPWPLPLTYNWLPMQEQYNILREAQINAAKRSARKYLYQEDTFTDEEELDKFTSNADMQGVQVTDLNRPPIMFGEFSQNPDVARNIPFIMNDWRIITGQSGTRLGDPDADTATEAVLIEQSAGLRDSKMRRRVDKWIAMAGRKMLQLVKQTLTLDMYVQIRGFSDTEFKEFLQEPRVQTMLALGIGAENVPAYLAAIETVPELQEDFRQRYGNIKPLRVTRSELQFEADVEVMPSSARPLQQAQLLRLIGVIGPQALFMSPTLLEELLMSFDIAQGKRISEEIMTRFRQMEQQMQATGGQNGVPSGRQPLRVGVRGATGGRIGI